MPRRQCGPSRLWRRMRTLLIVLVAGKNDQQPCQRANENRDMHHELMPDRKRAGLAEAGPEAPGVAPSSPGVHAIENFLFGHGQKRRLVIGDRHDMLKMR